mmetsp:Transcript_37533/g.57505  ORF Transcript_37533/g.57505 Transcript_37533/m.57505 type:complete len:215 (+) Transcript_37533:2586-3230(+)
MVISTGGVYYERLSELLDPPGTVADLEGLPLVLRTVVAELSKLVLTPREDRSCVRDGERMLVGASDLDDVGSLQLTHLNLHVGETAFILVRRQVLPSDTTGEVDSFLGRFLAALGLDELISMLLEFFPVVVVGGQGVHIDGPAEDLALDLLLLLVHHGVVLLRGVLDEPVELQHVLHAVQLLQAALHLADTLVFLAQVDPHFFGVDTGQRVGVA